MNPVDLGVINGVRYRLDSGAVFRLALDSTDYRCWEYVTEYDEWLADGGAVVMTDTQPGPELDKLFFERVEGRSVRQITDSMPEWVEGRDWALPGDYVIDVPNGTPYLCPAVSEEDDEALAALERFADKRRVAWTISRTPPMYPDKPRYFVTLFGDMMPLESQHAETLAHAIVLAILAAAETEQEAREHDQR